ncbi:MAG TPA: hypothetical protein VMT69_04410 [Kineosporiaceae bacterium]|nr:hypothetical protein [Kineosporiaceae bacterium]
MLTRRHTRDHTRRHTGGRPGRRPAGRAGDRGYSVVEFVVAAAVTGLLLAALATALTSVISAFQRVQDTSMADDRGRVVLDRLDRDLRQAEQIDAPQTIGTAAFVEYEVGVGLPAAGPTCTQWRLDAATRTLAVRSWPLPAPATAPAWATVATGVVNDLAAEPPFALAPAGGAAEHGRLTVQLRLALAHGQALTRATITARNSGTTGASDTCLDFGRS